MNIFLSLKHWQLFGLLMGLPMLFQFITIGSVMINSEFTHLIFIFPIMFIFVLGLFFAWFYSLGTHLYKKLPPTVAMNLTLFKTFLIIPTIYILLVSVFILMMFSNISEGQHTNPAILALIIPMHLFSMFCIFYCLYFIAKALKSAECQQPVTFSDFAGEFFLIWFLPIGIWIIQPRINKLFDTKMNLEQHQILN